MTGNNLISKGLQIGQKDVFAEYRQDDITGQYTLIPTMNFDNPFAKKYIKNVDFKKVADKLAWSPTRMEGSKLMAGGNLVADFKDQIEIKTPTPNENQFSDVKAIDRPEVIKAQNVLLHATNIVNTDSINAAGNITAIAEDRIVLEQGILAAGKGLDLNASNSIDARQSELKGQDITLTARSGEIKVHTSEKPNYYHPDGVRWLGSLQASRDLTLTAGSTITLLNTLLAPQSRNVIMTAPGSISILKNDAILVRNRPTEILPADKQLHYFNNLLQVGAMKATDSVLLNSGGYLALRGININAGKDVTLLAGHNADLNYRALGNNYGHPFATSRTPELSSKIHTGGNLLINAAREIGTQGATLSANGNITLLAGRNLWLSNVAYSSIDTANDNNKDDRHVITTLNAGKNLTAVANNQLLSYGAKLTSGDNMTLTSGGDMRFEAVQNHTYREGGKEFTETRTQQGTELNAGALMTVISSGSILFQATKLMVKAKAMRTGNMDIAAKGGYLYAQAMEESSHYEKTTKKRKWWGKKTEVKQTRHDVTNKVTEFTAPGNITLMSRDNSTYEASKVEAGKNAKLTSTHGQVNFKAVKNTSFEQTVTNSKGFFIKQANKGYEDNKWVLPSIHTGGTLTVDAAKGVSADVKVKNGQALQSAIDALGNTQGTNWVKDLNKRNDVQWNKVKDAYDSWNYKSQHLNPAVAAVIAIAAAAVTAGSSLTTVAAGNVTGAVGGGAVTSGAVTAGMASLASQAAVALVENQGNLSKTLQAMGSNESVKATATAMAVGGALNGFDSVMGWSKDAAGKPLNPNNVKLPQLSKGDWSKVAQRVAGQSVISSSLGTAINGGSFKDNFTTALLSNIGSQINAEGAKFIGDKGEVLGLPINDPRRVISHAVIAGVAAEIGGGNARGAAAGALAAELAAISLGNTFVDPALREIQITSTGRIIGALAGAAITGKTSGVNSGANAAESVLLYNFLMHDEPARMAKKLADCKGNSKCEGDIRKEITRLSAQNENKFENCRVAGNGDCINEMLSGISEASGFRELGLQIGFDIAGQYQQMGENAYDRFNTCGWNAGTGCALKLWGKEAVTEAVLLGAGWGVAKIAGPVIGEYLTEVGILSQKGALANIKSAQVGLKKPASVDNLKNKMKNSDFNFSKMENRIGGYVDKNGKYFILEGNHRMVAAKELYQETGNSTYIENLIKNGQWTYTEKYIGEVYSLPVRKK